MWTRYLKRGWGMLCECDDALERPLRWVGGRGVTGEPEGGAELTFSYMLCIYARRRELRQVDGRLLPDVTLVLVWVSIWFSIWVT
jgi:hypothetical protein